MKTVTRHPNGRSIILVDPPWNHQTWSKKGQGRTAASHYNCMTNQELLDLKELMQSAFPDNSLMFMWATGPQMEFAVALMKHWGWQVKTKAFTWVKLLGSWESRFDEVANMQINGIPLSSDEKILALEHLCSVGMGHYTRANPEYVIVGRRGKGTLSRMRRDVRELVIQPIDDHSHKPDEVNKRIELCFRRPQDECFELFARRQYKDWQCTGFDLDKLDVREALTRIANNERWEPEEMANLTEHSNERFLELLEELDI